MTKMADLRFDQKITDELRGFISRITDVVRAARDREAELLDTIERKDRIIARHEARLRAMREHLDEAEPQHVERGAPHQAVIDDIEAGMKDLLARDADHGKPASPLGRLAKLIAGENGADPLPEFPEEPRRAEA